MANSQPAGSNPLRRNCNDCLALDRCLNRRCAGKNERGESLDEVRIKEAKNVKEGMKKMSAEARAAHYKDQKAKRQQEDKKAPRTFAEPKGFAEQSTEFGQLADELDNYEVFEDFAARQIVLGRCKDEEGAIPLWDNACSTPGAVVIMKRGVPCLGRFTGVEMRNRKGSTSKTGLRQSTEIGDVQALNEFQEHTETRRKKFESRRSTEHECKPFTGPRISHEYLENVIDDAALNKTPKIIQASIVQGLEAKQEQEQAEDLRIQEAAEEAAIAKAVAKQKADDKASTVSRVAAIEKISLRSTVMKTSGVMSDTITKYSNQGAVLRAECILNLVDLATDDHSELLAKWKEFEDAIDAAKTLPKDFLEAGRAFTDADHTGEEFFKQSVECASKLKDFHVDTSVAACKDALKSLRLLRDALKKTLLNKDKESAKDKARDVDGGKKAAVVIVKLSQSVFEYCRFPSLGKS